MADLELKQQNKIPEIREPKSPLNSQSEEPLNWEESAPVTFNKQGDITSVATDDAPPINWEESEPLPQAAVEELTPVGESFFSYISKKHKRGKSGIVTNSYGYSAAIGDVSYDEARAATNKEQLDFLEKTGQIDDIAFREGPVRFILGEAAEALPSTIQGMKEGGLLAAILAPTFVTTAILAGQAGPQIAAPEEVLTVPIAFASGVTAGMGTGIFQSSMRLGTGGVYMRLRDAGISHESASPISVVAGGFIGLLENIQFNALSAPFKKAFARTILAKPVNNAIIAGIQTYAKTVGVEVTTEMLQQGVELMSQQLAATIEKNPNARVTGEQIKNEMSETFIKSLAAMSVISLPGSTVDISTGFAKQKQMVQQQKAKESKARVEALEPTTQKEAEAVSKELVKDETKVGAINNLIAEKEQRVVELSAKEDLSTSELAELSQLTQEINFQKTALDDLSLQKEETTTGKAFDEAIEATFGEQPLIEEVVPGEKQVVKKPPAKPTKRQRIQAFAKSKLESQMQNLKQRMFKKDGAKSAQFARLEPILAKTEKNLIEFDARNKARQTIIAAQKIKALPKTQLDELIKSATEGRHVSVFNKDITLDDLNRVVDRVKTARPRSIDGRKVITRKTENRIQILKENLIKQGELTEEDFNKVLKGLRISDPTFKSKTQFITESKGREVIKKMLNFVPIVKTTNAISSALAKTPTLNKEVNRIRNAFVKQKKAEPVRVNSLLDMHHFVDSMEKQTGAPFGVIWDALNEKRLEVDNLAISRQSRVIDAAGGVVEFNAIKSDAAAVKRINDFVASKLPQYVKGRPEAPINITPAEKRVAQAMSDVLQSFENDVRYNRFYEWYNHNTSIPNAPASELTKAKEILETQGDKALRSWLKGRSWGVIRTGYDIGYVLNPTIRTTEVAPRPTAPNLGIRESLTFREWDKNILERYMSYVRQMTLKTELKREVDAWTALWEANKQGFSRPDQVADLLSRNLKEILGKRETPQFLEKYMIGIYQQAARTIFLDPRKGFRNLFQNAAFFTGPEDIFRMHKLTPEEKIYFDTLVSQDVGIKRDFMFQDTKWIRELRESDTTFPRVVGKILGPLDQLNEIADAVNVMGRTDTINRLISFKSVLGRVDRALKKNPNWRTSDAALTKLMIDSGFGDLEPMERVHALNKLATKGTGEFKRFVAKQVTQNVHFLYERAQKAPAEQGTALSRVLSNLLTFRKGFTQRLLLDIRKLAPSQKELSAPVAARRRAARALLTTTVGATLTGALYQTLSGDDNNPYRADKIMGGLGLGGLATGMQETLNTFSKDVLEAVQGDKAALTKAINGVTTIGDNFIPFYDEVINLTEAIFGKMKIDRMALTKLREAVDKRIKARPAKHWEKQRSLIQAGQHAIFGTEAEDDSVFLDRTIQ